MHQDPLSTGALFNWARQQDTATQAVANRTDVNRLAAALEQAGDLHAAAIADLFDTIYGCALAKIIVADMESEGQRL